MRQKTRNNNIGSAKRPPQWIKPQPTRLVEEASKGRTWLHEIKLDGYRMHAGLDGGDIRLLTGTGLDWSNCYQAAISAFRALPLQNIYLDAVMRSPSRWRDVLHIEFNDVAESAHHRAAIVDLSVVGLRRVEFGLLSRDVERAVLTGSSGRRSARGFRDGERSIVRTSHRVLARPRFSGERARRSTSAKRRFKYALPTGSGSSKRSVVRRSNPR